MADTMNTAVTLPDLTNPAVVRVLWAAMCTMTQDVHGPQDQLSEADWAIADDMFRHLNEAMNNAE